MKVRSGKEQQRQRMQRETEQYLAGGGRIQRVASGVSGRDAGAPGNHRPLSFASGSPATRTDLSAVAAAIDARKRKPAPAVRRTRRARRKLIYDDFGEPLRWIWDDQP